MKLSDEQFETLLKVLIIVFFVLGVWKIIDITVWVFT